MTPPTVPPRGTAIVERIGWEDRDGRGAFTASLIWENGPPEPDLIAGVVWQRLPVRVVLADHPAEPDVSPYLRDHPPRERVEAALDIAVTALGEIARAALEPNPNARRVAHAALADIAELRR